MAYLQPITLSPSKQAFFPENDHLYLLIVLDQDSPTERLVVLNIPSDSLPRFYPVEANGTRHIVFLDDIIRENLPFIFPNATISGISSFKITRDAELDLEDEYQGNLAEKIEKKLAKRDAGLATRLLYEPGLPLRIIETLVVQLSLDKASVMEGGRYHNLRDLAGFPVKDPTLSYQPWPSLHRHYEEQPNAATPIDAQSENPTADPLSPTPIPEGAVRSQEAIYRYLAGI